jgi:hypothetical protein
MKKSLVFARLNGPALDLTPALQMELPVPTVALVIKPAAWLVNAFL